VLKLPRQYSKSAPPPRTTDSILIIPVIMCGGAGTRLWPASRESTPKQFMPLFGDLSTFQDTILRVGAADLFDKPIVVTHADFRFVVAEQLRALGVVADIVLEPVRRDSAPAVAVAALLAAQRSRDAIVLVLAADHAVSDKDAFASTCRTALTAAQAGHIVTFGIAPTSPATSYGYLAKGKALSDGTTFVLDAFVEKPNSKRAASYVDKGYLWNSGNFLFRADAMLAEIDRFAPEIGTAARAAVAAAVPDLDFLRLDTTAFKRAPKISIDYAVMEKTAKAAVTPAGYGWSDIGSWDAVWSLSPKDASGNALSGPAHVENASNVLIRSEPGVLTAVVGVDDIIVVATTDAVLVTSRANAEQVKQLVVSLTAKGYREATEHRRIYRPWGYYQGIDEGGRYQVKRIVVKPAGKLSLQKHFHRAEHWIVVHGTAEVTVDGKVTIVEENQSIYLPLGCVHRLANPGKIPLELIEVQVGSYLGEDDIVRFEDDYNRLE
jgi:mannose-1-phosphate guanylyltransferase/mannose-6-phosphate isomerase